VDVGIYVFGSIVFGTVMGAVCLLVFNKKMCAAGLSRALEEQLQFFIRCRSFGREEVWFR
jgi:hypothetical protein